jgi:undecaprenyl-diphosphatase
VRWDRHLETWIVGHRVAALNPVARFLSAIGTDGVIWLAIAAFVALALREWGALLWVAAADLLAQLSAILIKTAFPRARPHVEMLVTEPASHSFPSGHAASSFACALVLSAYVPKLALPLFILAALIAASRAYVGVHYPLDVIAGALLGLLVGALVLALRAATERRRSSSGSRGTR